MTAAAEPLSVPARSLRGRLSDAVTRRPALLAALLLALPLGWLAVVYVGSLAALLVQSFYTLDDFSGLVVPDFSFASYRQLLEPANLDVIGRTAAMAGAVTVACGLVAFPIALYAARHARGRMKAAFYLLVMLPLWSSYLVRVYAWKLILAKEGVVTFLAERTGTAFLLDGLLAIPGIGGPALSVSYVGTFLVFVYLWLPYMILPVQASLERVPRTLVEAAGDLGATPRQTLATVILPLALPGLAAGSIFTFSLTLGDYIAPQIVGPSSYFLGQVVYVQQGTAGNIPLAAAFSVVPVAIMALYLAVARRLGAFDAL